ncbi:unnamed protein product, partial [Coregonus sp. 'balchen']
AATEVKPGFKRHPDQKRHCHPGQGLAGWAGGQCWYTAKPGSESNHRETRGGCRPGCHPSPETGIDLKERLLDRPKLEEVVHEDGCVGIIETFSPRVKSEAPENSGDAQP